MFHSVFFLTENERYRAPQHEVHQINASNECTSTAQYKMKHTRTTISGNTLQHTATHCNTLQHITTHCNTLQRILYATHCNTLQHAATRCNTLPPRPCVFYLQPATLPPLSCVCVIINRIIYMNKHIYIYVYTYTHTHPFAICG